MQVYIMKFSLNEIILTFNYYSFQLFPCISDNLNSPGNILHYKQLKLHVFD